MKDADEEAAEAKRLKKQAKRARKNAKREKKVSWPSLNYNGSCAALRSHRNTGLSNPLRGSHAAFVLQEKKKRKQEKNDGSSDSERDRNLETEQKRLEDQLRTQALDAARTA